MTVGNSLAHLRELERMARDHRLESDMRVAADFRSDFFKGASLTGTVAMSRGIGQILPRFDVGGNAKGL